MTPTDSTSDLTIRTRWYESLVVRIILFLIVLFVLLVAIVYFVINKQARPQIAEVSDEIITQTGNEAVNGIMAQIQRIDGMALTAAKMTESLPSEERLYQETFAPMLRASDEQVVSGGVWFEPTHYLEDTDRKSFFWVRDQDGKMQWDDRHDSMGIESGTEETAKANKYYRERWYTPSRYSRHQHCVWSRAYIEATSQYPMMTCARSLTDPIKNTFKGVISIDLQLSRLKDLINQWQEITGGYIFLVDFSNDFLTFPEDSKASQSVMANSKSGFTSVAEFAKKTPDFAPIARALAKVNEDTLKSAQTLDGKRLQRIAQSILVDTQDKEISPEESEMLAAIMINTQYQQTAVNSNHLVEKVTLEHDFYLNKPAVAYIFTVPFTYWKMVVVKPTNEIVALADALSNNLLKYMLLGLIPLLAISFLVINQLFALPVRRTARSVRFLDGLIGQHRYLELKDNKIPVKNNSEIGLLAKAMNRLIDRIVDNEGQLAQINEQLEHKVTERTQELEQALENLKSSQVQLVRSEKLATLGQMVAGVAHEVNTPLSYVQSNLALLEDTISRYDELLDLTNQLSHLMQVEPIVEEDVNKVMTQIIQISEEMTEDELSQDSLEILKDSNFGIEQISELVINLRDFSRLDQSKTKEVNIQECIDSSLNMARNKLKSLTVHKKLSPVEPIECAPSQINQVLLNLFVNAAQAIPEGENGILGIATKQDKDNIYIVIKDNGKGIPEDVIDAIFEPFFTTKKSGEGTGLGLAISSQIIEQHGGAIQVESEVGKGTRFIIRLPKSTSQST